MRKEEEEEMVDGWLNNINEINEIIIDNISSISISQDWFLSDILSPKCQLLLLKIPTMKKRRDEIMVSLISSHNLPSHIICLMIYHLIYLKPNFMCLIFILTNKKVRLIFEIIYLHPIFNNFYHLFFFLLISPTNRERE